MRKVSFFPWILLTGLLFSAASAGAADKVPLVSPALQRKAAKDAASDLYEPKPIDGVIVQAVETYPNPKDNSFGFGIGIFPFNAYYTGILLNANYLHHLSRAWSWEILNVSYVYSYQNALTTELADRYNANPETIDRLSFLFSSDFLYGMANGKMVLLNDYIRYFSISAIMGLGFVNSTQKNEIAPHFGLRFEVLSSPTYTWRMDIRDSLTVPSIGNVVTFTLGVGYNF